MKFPLEAPASVSAPLPNNPPLPSYWAISVVDGTIKAANPRKSTAAFRFFVFLNIGLKICFK
jgi:hypothetical protein